MRGNAVLRVKPPAVFISIQTSQARQGVIVRHESITGYLADWDIRAIVNRIIIVKCFDPFGFFSSQARKLRKQQTFRVWINLAFNHAQGKNITGNSHWFTVAVIDVPAGRGLDIQG